MLMHGALLIDKPAGITSAKVVAKAKRILGVKKIGHSGTLDPMATGLLVLLCGNATRLQSLFLESGKEYQGEILLGRSTDSDDVTGVTISEDRERKYWQASTPEDLVEKIRERFSGRIEQRPPAVSAVHIDGVRSYKRVRNGEEVQIAPRSVEVEFLDLEFLDETTLRYHVRCSKGTYVRSLARDIGEFLESCACLDSIRRLGSTPFSIERAITLEDLEEIEIEKSGSSDSGFIVPMSELLSGIPRFELSESDVTLLRNGIQRPLVALDPSESELAGIFEEGSCEPVALLEAAEEPDEVNWKLRCVFSST